MVCYHQLILKIKCMHVCIVFVMQAELVQKMKDTEQHKKVIHTCMCRHLIICIIINFVS